MIKVVLGKGASYDSSLLNTFSEYLKLMEVQLDAISEIFVYVNDNSIKERIGKYQQKCRSRLQLYNKELKLKRIKTIGDRRSFDIFRLKIYEIFEIFLLGLRRRVRADNSLSNAVGIILMKIQNIFEQFKSEQQQIDIGLFLAKVKEVEVNFILGCLRKIRKNVLRDIQTDILKKLQEKIEITTRFSFPQKLPYQLPVQEPKSPISTYFYKNKENTSLPASPIKPTFKYSNELYKTIRNQLFNNLKQPDKQDCKYCKCLDFMEVTNLSEIFHNDLLPKSYQELYEQLSSINKTNKTTIDQFIQNQKKIRNLNQNSVKFPSTLKRQRRINNQSMFTIDHHKQLKLQQVTPKRNVSIFLLNPSRKTDHMNKNYVVPFDRVWSINNQQRPYQKILKFIQTTNDFQNKQPRKKVNFFPRLRKNLIS